MKLLITAIVFAIATPAAAQAVQPNPHAGHTPAQHQAATSSQAGHGTHGTHNAPMDHSKMDHSQMDHSKQAGCCPKGAEGKGMPCCEKMKAGGSKMACCEKAAAANGVANPHAGHDMGQR